MRSVEAPGWTLPEKQRFLVGTQKVMKLDLVEPLVLDARSQDALVSLASESADPLIEMWAGRAIAQIRTGSTAD